MFLDRQGIADQIQSEKWSVCQQYYYKSNYEILSLNANLFSVFHIFMFAGNVGAM